MEEYKEFRVKCPYCSKALKIKVFAGVVKKSYMCPVCQKALSFDEFIQIDTSGAKGPATELPNDIAGGKHESAAGGSGAESGGKTELPPDSGSKNGENTEYDMPSGILGKLVFLSGNISPVELKEGDNIIGREASSSLATVRVPQTYKRISREHIVITVKRVRGGYQHELKLYKQAVNPTMLNSTALSYGEIFRLNKGDIIKLPDLDVRFELPDLERTTFGEI